MKLIFALLLSLSSLAHCPIEFKTEGLCAELTWLKGPFLNVESTFEVKFWQKGSGHVYQTPKNEVDLYSWMIMDNGHSHGGPMISWTQTEEGVFLVEDARFFMMGMKGFWNVVISTKDENFNEVESHMVRVEF